VTRVGKEKGGPKAAFSFGWRQPLAQAPAAATQRHFGNSPSIAGNEPLPMKEEAPLHTILFTPWLALATHPKMGAGSAEWRPKATIPTILWPFIASWPGPLLGP